MSEAKVRQILIYRNGSDTPINIYDKSVISDKDFTQLLSNVFISPNISILNTSSGNILIKPSRIDAIEVIDNIDKDLKDLPINEIEEKSISEVTAEIEFDEEIVIGTVNIGDISDDKIDTDKSKINNDEKELVVD